VLASLVRTHRRGIGKSTFDAIPDRLLLATRRKAALLRLAVLLRRSHEDVALPDLRLLADGKRLSLQVPRRWLDARPLLHADLAAEPAALAALGIDFSIASD
jgi:exopolyphosphatase/guanosine-5'-triphosphate,3'-diphosphate pyrophosphatase